MRDKNPFAIVRHGDGTRTVYYFGQQVGNYARVNYLADNSRRWRGVSINGQVIYANNERAALQALISLNSMYN